jgi:nucleotide-binding universal stress UspA family protein
MLPIHTILFPTDFSENSEQVFPTACALARDYGARIVVLHVMPEPLGQDVVVARRHPEEYYGGPERLLHQIHAADDNVRVEHRLEEGDAAEKIVEVAKDAEVGLIVIGSQGRGGLARVLLGSVAERVLRNATCPVLTVKSPLVAVAEHNHEAAHVE